MSNLIDISMNRWQSRKHSSSQRSFYRHPSHRHHYLQNPWTNDDDVDGNCITAGKLFMRPPNGDWGLAVDDFAQTATYGQCCLNPRMMLARAMRSNDVGDNDGRAVIIAKTGQFLSSYHQKHHHPVVEVIGDGLTIGGWLLVTTLQLHIMIGGIFIGNFFHTILILGNFRIKMRNPIICPDPQLSRTVTTQIVTSWYPFARKMIAMRIVTRVVMVNLLAVGLRSSRTPTKNSI